MKDLDLDQKFEIAFGRIRHWARENDVSPDMVIRIFHAGMFAKHALDDSERDEFDMETPNGESNRTPREVASLSDDGSRRSG